MFVLECENITIKNDPFGSAIKSPRNVLFKIYKQKSFIILFYLWSVIGQGLFG